MWSSCCAYCFPDNPNSVVVSVNKAYATYASLLTLTFYCPSCAEGGCNMSPPKRAAICKAGTCLRRDSWTDDSGKTSSVEVPNDPAKLVPTPEREIIVTMLHRLCTRGATCGATSAGDCDQLKVPKHLDCAAADACYDAIDHMACPSAGATWDLFSALDRASKLHECGKLERACSSTASP